MVRCHSNFTAILRNATGNAAHLHLAIYLPESISTGEDIGSPLAGNDCPNLPPALSKEAHDAGEISLSSFTAPADGRQCWGEAKCKAGNADCCADGTRVGPSEEPCRGSRHFSGRRELCGRPRPEDQHRRCTGASPTRLRNSDLAARPRRQWPTGVARPR